MQNDYNRIIQERADHVFEVMAKRVSDEDMNRIRAAFELAREAHAPQKRKTGEPYILHPIAVANIAAEELMLGANPVIACFLHDVVEDTPYTIEDIRERFGDDVAFLVRVVTKKPTHDYELSKQLDNYRQLLNSMQYDIRAILVKLADRLHNMRTLASMKPEKQMKIAGETDYFYAPLANRLGLYNIKTELENLSFRFRCPDEYEEISSLIARHVEANKDNLETFRSQIAETLSAAGIKARVYVDYRRPFSLWRKMKKYGDDFNHLKYRHFVEVVFDETQASLSEKEMAMKETKIYPDESRVAPKDTIIVVNGVEIKMIGVKGGKIDCKGLKKTIAPDDFYIGETEVTQELRSAIMGNNPSVNQTGDSLPVENAMTSFASSTIVM